MVSKIRELREKRARLAAEAGRLIPEKGKGTMSQEDQRKFDLIMSEVDLVKGEIERMERDAEREADSSDPYAALNRELREGRETRRPPESAIGGYDEAIQSGAERRYRRAFIGYLRNGLAPDGRGSRGISDEDLAVLQARGERRDMGVSVGDLGGYFVPQGFVYDVEVALKFFGEMMASSKILDTATGNPLPYPTANDTTTTGEIVGEGQQVSDVDVNVGHLIFNAWKYSTKMVKVSLELILDSAFDVEGFLVEQFAIRLGRILNTHFTNGTGSSQPNGLVTALVATLGTPQVWGSGSGPGIPLIAAGSSGNTGGSETGANSIGSDDLFNLEHSVDPLYRKGSAYMMNDGTLRFLKTIKDKYGRPLWSPGLKDNAPDTINGYPYFLNNDMAVIGSSAVTMLFGPLRKYLVRRVKQLGVLRLTERFADYGQVAFIGFARYDGNLLDAGTHPVNYLIQHS
ncbi:MAG: phage major capsid protein [Candidatus Acidiferrales bacterium]